MDIWPFRTPFGGFDFSVLSKFDQNEISNLRTRLKNRPLDMTERLPSWFEPETPGKSSLPGFAANLKGFG